MIFFLYFRKHSNGVASIWSFTHAPTRRESNFEKTIKHVVTNGLWKKYQPRLELCVVLSDGNVYGFADAIGDMYEEANKGTEMG